jgi:hypothetical protein
LITLAHFDELRLVGQESDGVDFFKGEMTFVREDARIMESVRALEPAEKPEAVPYAKRASFLLHKKKEIAFYGNMTVAGDDLVGFDQKPGAGLSPLRGPVDGPFHQDALRTDESGDVGGREGWIEITLHREYSEKEEEKESGPGSPPGSFQSHQENPDRRKDKEKDLPLRKKGKVKLTPVNPARISDQDGSKWQAKYSGHLRPDGNNFSKKRCFWG